MEQYNFVVNGRPCRVAATPQTLLMDVLRDELRLTGVKDGCATGHCGSCMVIKDGEAVRACLVPMKKVAAGAEITTIEGLAGPDGALDPVQQAYIDQGATQCGFCTPGFIMATRALLDRNPSPSLEEIYRAHQFNICRCTGHNAILRAIEQAAGRPVPPLPAVRAPLRAISRPLPRPDAVDKVNGRGIYADDLYVAGMLHARALRSRYPHARVLAIDTAAARALPGVVAVLTADDIPGRRVCGVHDLDWPVLCGPGEKVRYVGDALALVVAESEAAAAAALGAIAVDYALLPVVTGPLEAARPDAPRVHDAPAPAHETAGEHPPGRAASGDGPEEAPAAPSMAGGVPRPVEGQGNCLAHYHLENGDVERGFAEADVVIEREYRTQTVEHAFLEPEAALAVPEAGGRLTVYAGGQIPFSDRAQIAATLGVPEEQVRVVNCLIGGGFGGKEDVSVQIHAALAAWRTGRPVKMVLSRRESLLTHPKRHATIIKMKTGAKRDGTLVAHEVEIWGDAGAYASLSRHVMLRATTHAGGPYEVPNARVDTYAMVTNNVPSGAFRGFGVTQSGFAMESQIDELAAALGLAPLDVRRRNLLAVGRRTLAGHQLTESCGLGECLERVVAEMDNHPFVAIEGDKRRAWGLALAYKNTGFGSGAYDAAGAEVELFADGRAIVRAGGAEIGQGLVGVLAQIVSEELGVPYERVDVLVSDTDRTPDGMATTASRQTYVSGNAARHASIEVRRLLGQTAAELLEAPPEALVFADGWVRVAPEGPDSRGVPLSEVVRLARREGRLPKVSYQYVAPMVPEYHHFAFGYGAQAALVEVDVKTGAARVLKVIAACDVGRVINPLALLGQVEGSISMGLGMALQENFVMRDGQVLTDTLHKCRLPEIDQTPEIVTFFVEDETREGPYGAKGVGELASIPTAPAIVNAIAKACGVRCYSLPADRRWLQARLPTPTNTGQPP
jgi:xanthine dehydrogenase molybdenum-binding subunit